MMDFQRIRKRFVVLTRKLHLRPLIEELFAKNLLHVEDFESLCSKPRIAQNQEFLLNIQVYNVLTQFSEWLKKTDSALFETLINDGDVLSIQYPNTPRLSREHMVKSRVALCEQLNTQVIAPCLFEGGIISQDVLESVYAEPTRAGRLRCLQDTLYRTTINPAHYAVIESALHTHQPSLLDQVMSRD